MAFIDAVHEGTHAKHSIVIFAWLYDCDIAAWRPHIGKVEDCIIMLYSTIAAIAANVFPNRV